MNLDKRINDFHAMIRNVVSKWESLKGNNSFGYAAPETSSTKSLVIALEILHERISRLENIIGDRIW
jgi:hypothetical protein